MNYSEAYNYIFNEISTNDGDKLLDYVAKNDVLSAIKLIMKLTECDIDTAEKVLSEVKKDYGTPETNPYFEIYRESTPEEKAYSNYLAQKYFNKPKCPTCGSTNISKIGTFNRMLSTGFFGLASGKIGKTMRCKNCGYNW